MLRVITWNTARRKQKALEQCRSLGHLAPDLVALQQVTPTTLPLLEGGLKEIGFENCVHSLGEIAEHSGANRTYGVLIASRMRGISGRLFKIPPEFPTGITLTHLQP